MSKSYPESTMFGTLPAYGFFCRHVEELRFQNLRLETSAADDRHAMVLNDVKDAVLDMIDAPFAAGAVGMILCANSQDILIRNCRPPAGTELFLDLRGSQTKDILLLANDLSRAKEVSHRGTDVPESALALEANNRPAQ